MIQKLAVLGLLILAAATGIVATIGAWRTDGIHFSVMGVGRVRSEVSGYLRIKSEQGRFALFFQQPDPGAASFVERKFDFRPVTLLHLHGNQGYFTALFELHSPLAVFLLLLYPLITAIRHYRRRRLRRRTGHCQLCGYNLAQNVSGVCPECGTTAVASTS